MGCANGVQTANTHTGMHMLAHGHTCMHLHVSMLAEKQLQNQALGLGLGSWHPLPPSLKPPFSYRVSRSVAVIKYPDESNQREGGPILAHSFGVQSLTAGTSWWQGLEVAGHIAFAGRKRWSLDNSAPLALSSLCNPEPNAKQRCSPPLGQASPPQYA